MMGPKQEAQEALFYEFLLEDHVPRDHLLRSIDRHFDLSSFRAHPADYYSHTGRPSIDPELLIRMLLVGYCFGKLRPPFIETRVAHPMFPTQRRNGNAARHLLQDAYETVRRYIVLSSSKISSNILPRKFYF